MTTPPPDTAALLSVIETLQETIQELNALIEELRGTIARQAADIARQAADNAKLVKMVEGLTLQLDALLAEKDEARRAELAAMRAEAQAIAPPAPSLPASRPKVKAPKASTAGGRRPLPPALPRDEVALPPPTACDLCGSPQLLAEETVVCEELDYVRAHLRVRRTSRRVCRCKNCNARVSTPAPPMPFDKVSCTFELMAWLLYGKCGMHLPLDRMRRDFKRQGVALPSATLTRWWAQGGDLLEPIAEAVRQELLRERHIHLDHTGLIVIVPRRKAQPKQGAPRPGTPDAEGWLAQEQRHGQVVIFGGAKHAVYRYAPSKESRHVQDFLLLGHDDQGRPVRWTGTIHADALNAYDVLFTEADRVEAGCNAHALRKLRDDADKAPLLASRAMAFIGRFYSIESEAREQGLRGQALLHHRQTHAGPIAKEYRAWVEANLRVLMPKNPVRKALQYILNHWDALTRFLHDPLVNLDNNAAERDLRAVALLRKNALYAGGEEGAKRLCTLFTLITTCERLGVEPWGYLVWALERVVPHPRNCGLKAGGLTPAAYQAEQERRAEGLSHGAGAPR